MLSIGLMKGLHLGFKCHSRGHGYYQINHKATPLKWLTTLCPYCCVRCIFAEPNSTTSNACKLYHILEAVFCSSLGFYASNHIHFSSPDYLASIMTVIYANMQIVPLCKGFVPPFSIFLQKYPLCLSEKKGKHLEDMISARRQLNCYFLCGGSTDFRATRTIPFGYNKYCNK